MHPKRVGKAINKRRKTMGHACGILTFDTQDRNMIRTECDRWAAANADYEETHGMGTLPGPIKFTSLIFDTYREAEEYLDGTFGDYRQTAVQYRSYPEAPAETKVMQDLSRRCNEYRERIRELEKPHYAGVTSKTVKCKKCGSSLSTEYCGKTWYNNCPVCRTELRPQTVIDKIVKYKAIIDELEKKRQEEEKKQLLKQKAKSKLKWAVACEVHC